MKSQKISCLKCHKRGDTLVCNNWDCPIAVHESCMSFAARFDDTGSFYCPYCLYKKSLVECNQAKANALLANRALVSFMDMRTKNDAGHFKSLKRKEPDVPTNIKKRDDAKVDFNGLHQPMQVEGGHHDDSHLRDTVFGNQQQAGPRRGHCLSKGSAAKDDGNLTKYCHVSVKEVEKYKCGRLEEVQTQACLTKADSTIENHEKSSNKSDRMLCDDHFMKMKIKKKLENAGPPHEIGDCRIEDEEKLLVKLANSAVCSTREDTVFLAQKSRNLTNELEETTKTVEGCFNSGEEREQTQTEFQETPRCLAITNTLEITENLFMGTDCSFQDDCSVRTRVVENFDRPEETVEDLIGRTDKGERKVNDAVHSTRNDSQSLPQGGLGNSTINHLKIKQTMERYDDRLVEKVQTQKEPEETSVCCIKEDSSVVIKGKCDGINDSAYQDGYSVVRQMMVNSGNPNQYVGVGKYQRRRTDEGQTNFKSPIKPSYSTKKGNEPVKPEKSGSPIKENKETSKPVEQHYNGQVEKEQTQEESQEGCVCLTKEDIAAITEELEEVKDSVLEDKMVKNSENADQTAEIGKDCYGSAGGIKTQRKALQDVHRPSENNAEVKHELGNLTRKHLVTKKTFKGYHGAVAEIKQTPTNLRSSRDDDIKVMVEESDTENYTSSHCGRTEEGKTRNEKVPVSCEEFSSADESSNTNYLGHGNHAARKKKMKTNLKNNVHGNFSENSDNEVKEHELPTHGESRYKVESIKQIQRSTVLLAERRRKLPWTAQEEEMLKVRVSFNHSKF
ncbi:hypothetical protein SOVF_079240 isoform A [Spinacia oleracea]|nr:hypothetical protein SOVF_079240 isoform A [Spinacia oleracea]